MRLTSMTDYAMRLLMYVGQHPDRLCNIAEVARAYSISEPHLMKITNKLAQRGWLMTVRGKNGGMRLNRDPADINLGAVVRDMESDLNLVECFATGSTCTLRGTCGLTAILEGALQQFLGHLDRYTLADILPQPAQWAPEHVRTIRLVKSD
ncbi:MAG TPA: Rrf2 family transcriptional regulator [Burkholderiaceae bacterium]|nr:Rrf2 family transcriptional regulator [Burkholderiaceae bacterium]